MTIARSLAAVAFAAMIPTIALAADVAFVGPTGLWRHVESPAQQDATRKFDQWRIGGDPAQTLTFMSDSTTSFADALALIHKNFTTNHIQASIDADKPCQGQPGHVVEFTTGPQGHEIIINRILVSEGQGIVTITYARGKDFDFDPDAKKSIDKFCSAS